MNKIFDVCVVLLMKLANLLGITYEALNVIIFVFIGPIVFLTMLVLIILLKYGK